MENNSYPGFWDSRVDKSKTGGLVWLPGWLRCLIKSYSLIDFKQRWSWRFIDVRRRNKVECFSAVFHCFAQRTEEIVSKSFFSLFDSFQLRELRAISLWLQICFKKAELRPDCVFIVLLQTEMLQQKSGLLARMTQHLDGEMGWSTGPSESLTHDFLSTETQLIGDRTAHRAINTALSAVGSTC